VVNSLPEELPNQSRLSDAIAARKFSSFGSIGPKRPGSSVILRRGDDLREGERGTVAYILLPLWERAVGHRLALADRRGQ